MRSLCVLFVVGLLVQLHMTSAGFKGGPDLTRFFSLEASSTCGDTPPSGSGDLGIVSCLPGERNASFVLDDDLESWWQSEDGESPVELTFSLQNVSVCIKRGWGSFLVYVAAQTQLSLVTSSPGGLYHL